MGVFDTYRVAGGEAGMRHFMAQFGPCLAWPWSHLTDVPTFDDALVELIAGQSDAQSGHIPIREMERIRDDNLVAILQALKAQRLGRRQAPRRVRGSGCSTPAPPSRRPTSRSRSATTARSVPPDWTDYNGHMNEARYLQAFADATDAFLRLIGVDADYLAQRRQLLHRRDPHPPPRRGPRRRADRHRRPRSSRAPASACASSTA